MRNSAIAAALAALVFGAVGYAAAAELTDPGVTFHGCVSKYSGALRVVAADQDCRRTEHPITWNQTGPAGPEGPAGPTSLDALDGTDCKRADGSAGTVAVTVGDDNAISMTCGTRSTWCASHTPVDDVFLHQDVTCDEATRTLTYTCDDGWQDANDDHVDGCEATTDPPTAIQLSNESILYLTILVPDRPTTSVDVLADCDASPAVSCTGGSPDADLSSVRVDASQHPGDRDRVVASVDTATKTVSLTQHVRIVTDEPIPVTIPNIGACTVSIDSRAGSSDDATLVYTDAVTDEHPNGPTVVSTPTTMTGLTSDDVTIGGDFACSLANMSDLSGVVDDVARSLGPWVARGATVCGAPEPFYFQRCSA